MIGLSAKYIVLMEGQGVTLTAKMKPADPLGFSSLHRGGLAVMPHEPGASLFLAFLTKLYCQLQMDGSCLCQSRNIPWAPETD